MKETMSSGNVPFLISGTRTQCPGYLSAITLHTGVIWRLLK